MSTLQIATPVPRSARTARRRGTATRPVWAPQPVRKRPATSRPVTDRPIADRPVADRPVADRSVVDRPMPASAGAVRPVAVRCAAPAPAPLRLTRRGRVVLTLLMLGLVLVAATFFGGRSAATGESGAPVQTRTVVVDRGDTMWAIASQVAHGRDVREVIHDIEELNALPGPELAVGQKIAVPVG